MKRKVPGGGGVVRKIAGADREQSTGPPVQPYRPRDSRSPRDFLDWSDRHLSRTTDDDQVLYRYVYAAQFLRSSLRLVGLFVLVNAALLIGGAMVALHFTDVPPWVAWAAVCLGGSGTSIGAYFMGRAVLRRLRGRDADLGSSV